jgi:tetratricopeptide (TPR) repeat protein
VIWLLLASLAFSGPVEDGARKAAQMHYLKAQLLEKRGDVAQALAEYEEALSHDPKSAFICAQAAELGLESNQPEKALLWALRLAELEPGKASSHVTLGRAHWAGGDAASAEKSFEKALKLDPESADSILSLASLLAVRSPEKARKLLEKFIVKHPDHAAEAHFQLAKLDVESGKTEKGIERLKKGLELEPENLALHFALAQTYETKHDTEAAIAQYQRILELEPYNVQVLDHVAEILDSRGLPEEARARFEQAAALQPNDPAANLWLSLDWERRGEFGRAAEQLKRSAGLSDDPSLQLRLSYYLSQAGRLKEAVAVLDHAHVKWPANDQIAYFLALGYDDLKQPAKAAETLREVLTLKPDFRDARFQLAILLDKAGDFKGAEKEFRVLLGDREDDSAALNYLGYTLVERGERLEEAKELILRAVALEPRNGAYRDSLGWAYFKLGRSSEAVQELSDAVKLVPDDETLWDHLGDAFAVVGSTESAWKSWKRAEALVPEQSQARKKAAKAQAAFTPARLGELLLEHFAALHGRPKRLSALARIEGAILGETFKHEGLLTFNGPDDLLFEVLGPMFQSVLRARINSEGFVLQPSQEKLLEPIQGTVSGIRDYLSGKIFDLRPASARKTWRGLVVELPDWRLGVSDAAAQPAWIAPSEGGRRVGVEGLQWVKQHALPRRFLITGLGYSVTITLDQVKVEYP